MTGLARSEIPSAAAESDLDALRRILGPDGWALLEELDRISRDPDRAGTAEQHDVAEDVSTWMLVTYQQLQRDPRAAGSTPVPLEAHERSAER